MTRTINSVAFLLFLGVSPSLAQTDTVPLIRVSATGTIDKAAERAVMTFGVETSAATANEAGRANAVAMDRLLGELRRLGSIIAALETSGYSVRPRYDRNDRGSPPTPTGYVVHNNVVVTVDSLTHAGRVIDLALESGANRAYGLSFQVRDPDAAYHEALTEALDQARRQAETLARAAGGALGPIISIETGGGYRPPRPLARARLEAMAADTPIEPGEASISATVTATYRLRTRPQ